MRFADRELAAAWWRSAFRAAVGVYWLTFAAMKWTGVGWMRPLMESAWTVNPIPGLREVLRFVVAPNWFAFAALQAGGETVVGVLLLVGLATRWAASLGVLLASNLALVVAFEVGDPGFRWLYYLAVLVNLQVVIAGGGSAALERWGAVAGRLRMRS